MENYLDINLQKYDKYRTLFGSDPYNPTLYRYKMLKYKNRLIDALNASAQTGGTSVQFIGDTYLTNLDTYRRIQRVKDLLAGLQTDLQRGKIDQECIKDHTKLMLATIKFLKQHDADQQTNVTKVNEIDTKINGISNSQLR